MELKIILSSIPSGLTGPLEDAYNEIVRNYREGRWEPSELNGGKLCEVVYSILRGYVDASYPATPCKPSNMVLACNAFEKATTFDRSIRIQIPRIIIALYEVRNNRGVGHVGGEVNPNHMDAIVVLHMAKWIVSELVRIFHGVSTEEATKIVEAISDRTLQLVWKVNGTNRVLDPSLSFKDKTLALLYGESNPLHEKDLIRWVEHSNASVFKRDVLRPLHSQRFLEFDEKSHTIQLSPTGIKHVEENIKLTL